MVDENVWAKIDAAVGGSARFNGALMIDDPTSSGRLLVVVVERRELPGDSDLARRFELTAREAEVARLMADRLSNLEVSRRLGISIHTARRYSEKILFKLDIGSRNDVRAALLDSSHAPAIRFRERIA